MRDIIFLLAIFAVLNALDAGLTRIAIESGGVELNPFAGKLIDAGHLEDVKGLLSLGILATAVWIWLDKPDDMVLRRIKRILIFTVIFYAGVVVNNLCWVLVLLW